MPELPEVEVLVRHLRPLLLGKRIRDLRVLRERVIRPTAMKALMDALKGARFQNLRRRGKYLVFRLQKNRREFDLLGHLGMTGRMYLMRKGDTLPKHASIVLGLGPENFVFEDTRYFGRFTLDTESVRKLGPEPLAAEFHPEYLARSLRRSIQPIKVKLLDQRLVAGIGNIYASEALFRAGISPRMVARRVTPGQLKRLHRAVRNVLDQAIRFGSTVPLNYAGKNRRKAERLFYFGKEPEAPDFYTERLLVYDRAGRPCTKCGIPIRRITQAARSTFFCPKCQRKG